MANVKIELNREGVRELLRSSEMMAVCEEQANKACAKLGNGYKVTTKTGKTRVNASIAAESYKARKENAENNTILKALKG